MRKKRYNTITKTIVNGLIGATSGILLMGATIGAATVVGSLMMSNAFVGGILGLVGGTIGGAIVGVATFATLTVGLSGGFYALGDFFRMGTNEKKLPSSIAVPVQKKPSLVQGKRIAHPNLKEKFFRKTKCQTTEAKVLSQRSFGGTHFGPTAKY